MKPLYTPSFRNPLAWVVGACALCMTVSVADAQLTRPGQFPEQGKPNVMPPELDGVDITEKLQARLPLDLEFNDETGAPIKLGSLFDSKRPVILTFNYATCPMLCSVQLGGLIDVMNQLGWELGDKFKVITVGIDPNESHRDAFTHKRVYLDRYDPGKELLGKRFVPAGETEGDRKAAHDAAWTYLTGDEASIKALADSVGFSYRYHEQKKQYLHPTALMMVSPTGLLSGYLYGIKYEPPALRDKLISAAMEEPNESTEQFLLSCYHYEPPKGFAATALKIMRLGGLFFVVGLLAVFGLALFIRSRRNNRARIAQGSSV